MKVALYAFSGDPITYGHINIIERALEVFDELVVGIGMNPTKKYFFSLEERRQIAEKALQHLPRVKVVSFTGLLVDYAYENGIKTVVRGLRNSEDLNYEMLLHQIGDSQKLNIDTVYFPAKQELMHVSSGASKALQLEQGFVHDFVPIVAKQKLEERLSGQYIISVTGEIGVGKSFISKKIKEIGEKNNIPVHIIDIDEIGHQILGKLTEPLYVQTRKEIAEEFNIESEGEYHFINRKELGLIIFNDKEKLDLFNQKIYKPLLLKLRRKLYHKKGIIILDSALIAESEMTYLSNNNVILIHADWDIQKRRLIKRGYSDQQIINRKRSQFNYELKLNMTREKIKEDNNGKIRHLNNSYEGNDDNIKKLFHELISDMNIKSES